MKRAFTTSADYYEILSDNDSRLAREGPLLLSVLKESQGKRVVDIACGTGLHAAFFASHGAQVDAFDVSSEMIAHAREKRAHPTITFHTGDMRELSGGPWDIALCLGNSLSLLENREDMLQTMRNVLISLAPRGRFVIQTLNYAAPSAREPRHRISRKNIGGAEIIAVKNLVPRGDSTLLSLSFFSFSNDSAAHIAETAILKNWSEKDITKSLETAGFAVEGLFGGFDRSPYNPEQSEDIVCIAVKKNT